MRERERERSAFYTKQMTDVAGDQTAPVKGTTALR